MGEETYHFKITILGTPWVIKNDFRTKEREKCPHGGCSLAGAGSLLTCYRSPGLEAEALALGPALESEDLIFLRFKRIVITALLISLRYCKGQH